VSASSAFVKFPEHYRSDGHTVLFAIIKLHLSLGRETATYLPSRAQIKNEWSYTFTPPPFLHGVSRGNFAFVFAYAVTDYQRYTKRFIVEVYLEIFFKYRNTSRLTSLTKIS
jgi:hypothetical protein